MVRRVSERDAADRASARNPAQDIYGTNRRVPGRGALSEDSNAEILGRPWAEAIQRQRRITILQLLVVLLTACLVAIVVVYEYILPLRARSSKWQIASAASRAAASPLDLNADVQTQFLMDELANLEPQPIPEGGAPPLTAPWVKQAAFHLIEAEKADREQRYEDALAAYAKAQLIFPELKEVNRLVGLIQLRQKDYKAAAATFEKVAQEEEMTFGLANNLGVSYLALEEYDKAEQNFVRATRLNPEYALAYFNLATLYFRRGDLKKAAEQFERYVELKPTDIAAAQTYAMILVQLKEWEKAIVLLEQIARTAPDVAPIYFRLAEALSHTPNKGGAIEALRRASALVDPRKALSWMSRPEFDLLRNEAAFQQLLAELGSTE